MIGNLNFEPNQMVANTPVDAFVNASEIFPVDFVLLEDLLDIGLHSGPKTQK